MPARIGRELAAAIPRCNVHFLAVAGHLPIVNHWREILQQTLD